jgi:adenine-specific DNA methylase/O-acetyl-ADP-ribose deacetylase (regulator of RNase III)
MLQFTKGNMFATHADIRVNTVNCVGVMGAGVALAFKERFPEMFKEYKRQCELGLVRPGELHVWKNLSGDWIINFPTKRHWREKSKYEDIESGLVALREYLSKQGKVRVTLPALGSGHGGLDWSRVSTMIQEHLEGLEAEIIVFDPADSRNIESLQTTDSSPEPSAITRADAAFPRALSNLDCDEIYYQGDVSILKDPDLTIALSLKPSEREEMAAIASIGELPKSGLTLCLMLGNVTATKLAGTALKQGIRVAAWVPQGLSRYRLPAALREVPQPAVLLLLSLAKPQQSWNPRLAYKSRIASLVTSKVVLVTDPEPTWLAHLKEASANKGSTRIFYIRYQGSEAVFEKHSKWLSAKAIGRRSCDGKPNLTSIIDELGLTVSKATILDTPQGISGETVVLKGSEVPPQHSDQLASQSHQNRLARYPKRLIEVDLPIKRISAHARREKSIRHGHISTLHIWWARRPLAACRAVICASLWFDPTDENCPVDFREEARQVMRDWADVNLKLMTNDAESFNRFSGYKKNPTMLNSDEELRAALLDFIACFANWDNSTVPEFLETSRRLTESAHVAAGGEKGTRPLVVDPFAGGGAIPLEALRVGADTFASDLNPVPVLLNKVVLEYIPRYGQRLADEVRRWGAWVKEQAEKELAEFYPKDSDGATPIAFLWARTIQCEGPGCGAEIPLIKSLWLGKKPHNSWSLRLIPNHKLRRVDFEVVQGAKPSEVGQGTVRRGSAVCPCCGFTTPATSIRKQLAARNGGTSTARLFCVVTKRQGEQGRFYRLPNETDLEAVAKAETALSRKQRESEIPFSLIPDEPLPPQGTLGFRVQLYGMKQWGHLFSPRQALVLATLNEKTRAVREQLKKLNNAGLGEAVQAGLALNVDKMADYGSSLASWSSPASQETVRGTFSRQALAMVWDFAEAYPFVSSSGGWTHNLNFLTSPLEAESQCALSTGHVERASATCHPLPDDSVDAFVTDPPYYDAIPYADLSDYFIVWLKRSLEGSALADNFASLSQKDQECVVDEIKGHDAAFFERTMGEALAEGRRLTKPEGIGIVVFAHKSTQGWEAQIQAMIDAGWIITGSWPIDTEREGRVRANSSAALASSVHLVCRPREMPDGMLRVADIGDWRDVLRELPIRIHEWMPRLAKEGVVGADAIFACLGPALEVFSRYSRVEKASGEQVTLREYLEYVWAAVAKEALSLIFAGETDADVTGFEEDARLTAMWLWTLFAGATSNGDKQSAVDEDADDSDDEESSGKSAKPGGFTLEYDAARKIAQGLGAHLEELTQLIEVKGDKARLLPVAERTKHLFGKEEAEAPRRAAKKKDKQAKLFDTLDDVEAEAGGWGEKSTPQLGDTVLDRVHQAMILFAAGRSDAMRRFLVDDGVGNDERFWRLANALSALYPAGGDEKRWVDGVLARKKGLGF